jgi:hypothetical protein
VTATVTPSHRNSDAQSTRFATLAGLCVLPPLDADAYEKADQYRANGGVDHKPDVIVEEDANDAMNLQISTEVGETSMIIASIENTNPVSVHHVVPRIRASSIISTPSVTEVRVR